MGRFSRPPRERRFYLGNFRGTLPAEERSVTRVAAGSGTGEGSILLLGTGRGVRGLEEALEARGMDVTIHAHPGEALRWLEAFRPDTVVLHVGDSVGPVEQDVRLIAEQIRELGIFLIALSDCRRGDETSLLLEWGCHDVVCPPHSAASVLMRRQVLRSRRETPREARRSRRVSLGPLTVDLTTRQVTDVNGPVTLSGREFELLVRLMEAQGDVVSREELLDDIWGEEQDSAGVLDATVHRLRRKLDGKVGDQEMVSTVRGIGYRLAPAVAETAYD